jgi:hypothetical protein
MTTATIASSSTLLPVTPDYYLADDGAYCVKHYDRAPAFCSFLPGVAGLHGVPLWCMYVNRGQAIASFGVHNKDEAIVEYLPATWAYQLTGIQGFRTFLRCHDEFFEPFAASGARAEDTLREMRIHPDRLEITEHDAQRGLLVSVEYYSPANQPLGMLVRRVQITNISNAPLKLELLDGLPLILPAGVSDGSLKGLRHITEAYAYVREIAGGVPFYAAKVTTHDEAEIQTVTAGNFYAAYKVVDSELERLSTYVDPHVIFGGGQDLVTPRIFAESGLPDRSKQIYENRLACALAADTLELAPQETCELIALIGSAPDIDLATRTLSRFNKPGDFDQAAQASRDTVASVTEPAFTVSAHPVFDHYSRQTYLDNVLRGGVPLALPAKNGSALLHPYARRHGDLERDYNYFVLPPHPLSAGAGNYRDICQNRRYDTWFYPEVGDLEIRSFLALIQADGFNPLGITGSMWSADAGVAETCCPPGSGDMARDALAKILERRFQPGELLAWCDRFDVKLDNREGWLREVLELCQVELIAGGHEGGYWVDHWTYIVDLLEAFAGVYPDRVSGMLTDVADIGWFHEGAIVQPRSKKYQQRTRGPMQLDAVIEGDAPATAMPAVTPLAKLAALIAVKSISFDANLRGIEMEAGRPGWNDSMNGLPGLFGSSSCEVAELARLAAWVRQSLPNAPAIQLPRCVAEFVLAVVDELGKPYDWESSSTLRETFVAQTLKDSSALSELVAVPADKVQALFELAEQRALQAISNAREEATGLIHTYFENIPRGVSSKSGQCLSEQIKDFDSSPLPLYLEGQVHAMRLMSDPEDARRMHHAIRRSGLYDTKLEMYKLNECLDACSHDIGRARTFTRGWFENESIWLHMSYKYLLELLRIGLAEEFYSDAQTMLVPFMDPRVYGRSILENSSFIGSSANPDPATHGRGFIARLSGSSAEFIHIWLLMTVGETPFTLSDAGELQFAANPQLPGSWFTTDEQTFEWRGAQVTLPANSFACALLGDALLIYHNPQRRDTFGQNPARPISYRFDDQPPIQAASLSGANAASLRDRSVARLTVELG